MRILIRRGIHIGVRGVHAKGTLVGWMQIQILIMRKGVHTPHRKEEG